jgi:hypothetical protein
MNHLNDKFFYQRSKAQIKAAPLFIQKLYSESDLQATEIIKLVEWPVVESVPALFFVLYIGISDIL